MDHTVIVITMLSLSLRESPYPYHLSHLGHFLDVRNDFLLLLLHLLALPVQVTHGLVEGALVLPQHLLRRHLAPKEPLQRHVGAAGGKRVGAA